MENRNEPGIRTRRAIMWLSGITIAIGVIASTAGMKAWSGDDPEFMTAYEYVADDSLHTPAGEERLR